MKIIVYSDLHLEFYKDKSYLSLFSENKDSILVLSGDIWTNRNIGTLFEDIHNYYKHIIYITGNHEYYDNDIDVINSYIKEEAEKYDNVHFLYNSSVFIDGYKFIGSTLWTNFDNSPIEKVFSLNRINDFSLIHRDGQLITPYHVSNLYEESITYLNRESSNSDCPTILVTHFCPDNIVRNKNKYEFSSYYYTNALRSIQKLPILWIYGHDHESCDTEINGTRFVSNPYGYKNKSENNNFIVNKQIELPDIRKTNVNR